MPEEIYIIGAIFAVVALGFFVVATPQFDLETKWGYAFLVVVGGFAAHTVFINTTFWDTPEGLFFCMSGNILLVAFGGAVGNVWRRNRLQKRSRVST